MKIIEEHFLHKNYLNIKKFIKENKEVDKIYKNIDDLNIFSVQKSSIDNDISFFDEISFILSVIVSIVTKPRIVTKLEETVIRSELCPRIQQDSLQKTIQDSRLWKHKGLELLPKEVYYNESNDEIATYENKFIVKLIDIIDLEIHKYLTFYMSIVKTIIIDEDLLFSSNNMDLAINKINNIDHRIKYIKNTYFYKVIKKQVGNLGKIVPTNILLKNRLYNYCFKFYRKYISYNDNIDLYNEFKEYYYFLILKSFHKLNYKLLDDGKYNINRKLTFRNKFFVINVFVNDIGFKFNIINRYIKNESINHLLLLDVNNDFSGLNIDLIKEDNYFTKEAINIFRICDINVVNNNLLLTNLTNNVKQEEDLILFYLKNKTQTPQIQNDIYRNMCPVCKSGNIIKDNNNYICKECNSVYTFFNDKNNSYVYFKKLRRKS